MIKKDFDIFEPVDKMDDRIGFWQAIFCLAMCVVLVFAYCVVGNIELGMY